MLERVFPRFSTSVPFRRRLCFPILFAHHFNEWIFPCVDLLIKYIRFGCMQNSLYTLISAHFTVHSCVRVHRASIGMPPENSHLEHISSEGIPFWDQYVKVFLILNLSATHFIHCLVSYRMTSMWIVWTYTYISSFKCWSIHSWISHLIISTAIHEHLFWSN